MIAKSTFRKHLYEKIMSAMKVCDDGNVIDMRLYIDNGNANFLDSGIFSIFETDELYEQVKNLDADWFIDFYENIAGANTAEYTDVSLFRDACRKMSVEEFDAKWGVNVDRYTLSEEVEKDFVEDAFNMYETGGFSPTFHTPFTDRADMNGVAFQVIGRATTEECDLEQLPVWKIEFEDGTEDYAYPCEITEIERKIQNLAQNLQIEKPKPIKEENAMSEKINDIVNEFNKEFGERTFNEILGCAKINIDGLSLVRDVDEFNNNEIACEVMFKGINFKVEVYRDFAKNKISIEPQITPRMQWENAKENAICLWDSDYDACFVEITPKFIKFFKTDYHNEFTCYEYPSLAEMKKDKRFVKDITDCLVESCQYDEGDMNNWIASENCMPPFPISVIIHSEYQNYKFTDWE